MRAWKDLTQWAALTRADVVGVSIPKCGRTWLRVLVGKAICLQYDLDDRLVFDDALLRRKSRVPLPFFTHDSASNTEGRHYRDLDPDKSKYRNKKVLFLYRDPRDVVVSAYYQATSRKQLFDGDISSFVRDPRYGIRKILTFYNHWHRAQDVPRAFHLVRYQQLREAPEATLAGVLDFLGAEPSAEIVADAVAFGRFDRMRKMEREQYFKSSKLRPSDPTDPNSFKTRRGVVGGYRDALGDEDLRYVDEQIASLGCGFGLACPDVHAPIVQEASGSGASGGREVRSDAASRSASRASG